MVELLKNNILDFNKPGYCQKTSLHHAMRNYKILSNAFKEMLVEQKLDWSAKDQSGKTPLDYAPQESRKEMNELFFSNSKELKFDAQSKIISADDSPPSYDSLKNISADDSPPSYDSLKKEDNGKNPSLCQSLDSNPPSYQALEFTGWQRFISFFR